MCKQLNINLLLKQIDVFINISRKKNQDICPKPTYKPPLSLTCDFSNPQNQFAMKPEILIDIIAPA